MELRVEVEPDFRQEPMKALRDLVYKVKLEDWRAGGAPNVEGSS